jgi:hypothetical protein
VIGHSIQHAAHRDLRAGRRNFLLEQRGTIEIGEDRLGKIEPLRASVSIASTKSTSDAAWSPITACISPRACREGSA